MVADKYLAAEGYERAHATRALRVLVVEDDRDTVLSLLLLLRSEGYDVKGVGSAKEMWESMGEYEPDVVLIDIGLPDRNGYEIARNLRRLYGEDGARPTLIAVTAWNKGSDKILAQIAGFDHHVGKPYEANELLVLLRPLSAALRG